MNDETARAKFYESRATQRIDDRFEVPGEKREEIPIRDVPGGNNKQAARRPTKQVTVTKIPVLCHQHAIRFVGYSCDTAVRRPIPRRQLRGVDGIVARRFEQMGEPQRQLGVDEEVHAAPSGTTRR